MALLNHTIMEKVWLEGSNDLQQRVPQPTESNMAEVFQAMSSYKPVYNEVADALVNLIGSIVMNDYTWVNVLRDLKRDNLLPMGYTIEEYAFDLIKGEAFDFDTLKLLETNEGKIKSAFHSVNSQLRYEITIQEDELRKAFLSPSGLSDFVTGKLNSIAKSAEYDEYRQMVYLIALAYAEDGITRVQTPIADPANPTESELKYLSRKLREVGKKMTLVPSTQWTKGGLPTVSRREDLVIITTPEITSALDVNVLADAFNVSRTDFVDRVIEIDEFPIPGVYALLVDKNWFIATDTVRELESFRNGATRGTNFWLHKHSVFSVSPFANAAIFGEAAAFVIPTVEVDLTAISAEVQDEDGTAVTSVEAGSEYKLVVSATATITPDDGIFVAPSSYVVSIVADAPIDARTQVTPYGTLRVQEDLPAGTELTLTVKSAYINPSTGNTSTLNDEVTLTVA